MSAGQILFRGDDQKVVEEMKVDADEWRSWVVSVLHGQLSHGTLVHEKTPAYDQRDWLEEEEVC